MHRFKSTLSAHAQPKNTRLPRKASNKKYSGKKQQKEKKQPCKARKKKKHLSLIYSDTKGYYFIHEIRTECYENGTLR